MHVHLIFFLPADPMCFDVNTRAINQTYVPLILNYISRRQLLPFIHVLQVRKSKMLVFDSLYEWISRSKEVVPYTYMY